VGAHNVGSGAGERYFLQINTALNRKMFRNIGIREETGYRFEPPTVIIS